MADKSVRGRFVWHELTTPDAGAAHTFYSKVLGWSTQPYEHDPSYQMFASGSGPQGGSVQSTDAPNWLTYIGTPDIDATVQQVTRLGGSVKKEITTMANGSKYAILADPQGAPFGVYWSSAEPSKESPPKRGEYSWHELATSDTGAASGFYSSVFGWDKMQEHDMGPGGKYLIFGRNGAPVGGIWKKPADMPGGPAWLAYVRVRDVHQTAKKAKAAGGTVVNGPMEVPGGDWIVQFVDAQGVLSAAHALAADVKPAAAPAAASAPAAEAPAAKPAAAEKKPAAAKPAAAPAKKAPAKKAPAKKAAAPKKKKVARKPAARKAAKKKSAKKKGSAARSAKRPARKAARKAAKKKSPSMRSGGKKKSAKKPRKGK